MKKIKEQHVIYAFIVLVTVLTGVFFYTFVYRLTLKYWETKQQKTLSELQEEFTEELIYWQQRTDAVSQ
jgi:hypothetical protein